MYDCILLVPTNAHIIPIYISPYLAATCFDQSPSTGGSQPNSGNNKARTHKPTDMHTVKQRTSHSLPVHSKLARHNTQAQDPIRIVTL